jgi:serine/threonine protein phosphatase PrpC
MQVKHAGRTDVGLVRKANEDSMFIDAKLQLFVVCDGVGGRVGGAVASKTACEHIGAEVAKSRNIIRDFAAGAGSATRRDIGAILETAISSGSAAVRRAAASNPEHAGMATTNVTLLVAGSHAFIGHVGDSRVYLVRQGVMHPLTEDHSVMNDMKRRGRGPERGHIGQTYTEALTRALGVLDSARVDLLDLELIPGDRFILCTDGIHGVLGDDQMQVVVPRGSVQEVADDLIEAALQKGAPDNATALVLDVLDDKSADRAMLVRRRLEALQGVSMFRYLPYADLIRVAGIATERLVPPGTVLCTEGEFGESLFIILQGSAVVQKGDGVTIAELQPGQHVGEMSLIERAPRSATVVSKDAMSVLVIERDAFFGLLSEEQTAVKLLWGLVRMLNARLRSTSDELSHLKARN